MFKCEAQYVFDAETSRSPNDIAAGSGCQKLFDVAFLIDKTSNMNYDNYQNIILLMVANVVNNLQVDTGRVRVALGTFSDMPTIEFYFNTYTLGIDISGAIRRASYGGSKANLADALRVLRTDIFNASNGHRTDQNVSRVAVVITDNVSTNKTATLLEAQRARDAGISIVVLGIGTYLDPYELSAVASYPYRVNTVITNTVKTLQGKDFENSILNLVCNSESTCFDFLHNVNVYFYRLLHNRNFDASVCVLRYSRHNIL